MAYLVLARKWRPQTFADLVGQEHVSQTLGNAIRTGRVHHAFLFTGARGVGKTSAARILAKALNCGQGPTVTPCNECPSCLEITAGQGIDVFEIDGASNTGVDDVRELRENIRYLPSRSRFKIFIIDEVHMLSINAFNALLKTLEEPPEHAKFIFATTEPHKIPVTILSRCQRFDFRKISLAKIAGRLREIVTAEQIKISDRGLALIARRGEGSMRDALSALDQIIAFCGDAVADEDVQGLLGLVDRRLLFEAVEGAVRRDSRQVLEAVRRVDYQGYSFRQFCQELVDLFRALVLVRVLEDPGELLDLAGDELQEIRELGQLASLEDHQRSLTLLLRTEAELANASFPRLTLETALVRLTQLPPARDVAALIRKLEEMEGRLAGTGSAALAPSASGSPAAPAREPAPREAAPAKKPAAPAPPPSGNRNWPGLVEFVKTRRRPVIASILEQASPLAIELPLLHIGLPKGSFALGQLEDRDYLDALTGLAGEYFGGEVRVKVSVVAAGSGQVPPSLAAERKERESDRERRLREDALAHPMVQAATDIFGARLVEIKPTDKGFV
jgi:DNA polymerase-3 subunit gamma/tau